MSDGNDPGDEDRRSFVEWESCPFCDRQLPIKHHCTPVMHPMTSSLAEVVAAPLDSYARLEVEVLRTCFDCADAAHLFAIEQRRDPEEKRVRFAIRCIEQRWGIVP